MLFAGHFVSINSTGLPYSIIITKVTINGINISNGSEIGVFDDTLCVGTALFDGNYNLPITAWKGDISQKLLGFKAGSTIKFKIWTEYNGCWSEYVAVPDYEIGDGKFGTGGFTVAKLNISALNIEKSKTVNKKLKLYPNPCNGNSVIELYLDKTDSFQVDIYDLTGRKIGTKNGIFSGVGYKKLYLSDFGVEKLCSGSYLIKAKSGNDNYISKIIYLK